MNRRSIGFTLIEVMVVVTIVGILSAVIFANFSKSSGVSRDAQRQADLRILQTAIELYKNENGRYPAGCNGVGGWSGQAGTSYACASGSQYIVGLAPKYIGSLPLDPKLNGATSGYVYTVNTEGTVYKLMAKNTVESQIVDYAHELKSCDATNSSTGMCDATYPANSKPNWCQENSVQFRTSFAVWGGYANMASDILVERRTEDIICDVP